MSNLIVGLVNMDDFVRNLVKVGILFILMGSIVHAESEPSVSNSQSVFLSTFDISETPLAVLKKEVEGFESVRIGLALSLAQCHEKPDCQLTFNQEELDYLLDVLQQRVDGLSARVEEENKTNPYSQRILALYEKELNGYFYYYDLLRAGGENTDVAAADINPVEDGFGLNVNEYFEEEVTTEDLLINELINYLDDPIEDDVE